MKNIDLWTFSFYELHSTKNTEHDGENSWAIRTRRTRYYYFFRKTLTHQMSTYSYELRNQRSMIIIRWLLFRFSS